MVKYSSILLLISLIVLSCDKEKSPDIEIINDPTQPNILFVIADDMGKDATPNYSEGQQKPLMPTLEKLASNGMTFDNVWTYPVCSPTRASVLTGKLGYYT